MKNFSTKKGNNLVEYLLIGALVGVVGAYAFVYILTPEKFQSFFKSSLINGFFSENSITVGPIE